MNEGRLAHPARILETLARHEVDYVLIGGAAMQVYGSPRVTNDIDIIPAPGQQNARRLSAALKELAARLQGVDADLLDVDPTDPMTLSQGGFFTLQTTAGELDLFTPDAPGAAPYPQLRGRALIVELAGYKVAVAGRDDLIALKRAAGRPVDLDDIAVLTDPLQQAAAQGEELTITDRQDPAVLLLGECPHDRRRARIWDRAATTIHTYRINYKAQSTPENPLGRRPTHPTQLRAWENLVTRLADTRQHLREAPLPGDLGTDITSYENAPGLDL